MQKLLLDKQGLQYSNYCFHMECLPAYQDNVVTSSINTVTQKSMFGDWVRGLCTIDHTIFLFTGFYRFVSVCISCSLNESFFSGWYLYQLLCQGIKKPSNVAPYLHHCINEKSNLIVGIFLTLVNFFCKWHHIAMANNTGVIFCTFTTYYNFILWLCWMCSCVVNVQLYMASSIVLTIHNFCQYWHHITSVVLEFYWTIWNIKMVSSV